ncbi:hypothetical protein OPT61_g501 [Boeremia exigua]|uniref:Uncharacterized protein n=1 Tax=Boeremia exigua TaxID=749465 RepID=A0ACC2ITI6_9PLEO|nr:hypothetical protein OPT61_g501 [Boeremia exigua]
MYIPHKDANPPPFIYRLDYPKEEGLTWGDFHPERAQSSQSHSKPSGPHWRLVANEIQDLRTRFAKHNAQYGNPRCSGPDRTAVLSVYAEALTKLEHTSVGDAYRINLEVISKVKTILDLRTAEPNDPVFYTADALLRPLEPQYAQPRLDFYGRTDGSDDCYYYAGFARLTAWREEGWPEVYPVRAVEQEMRERKRRWETGDRRQREALDMLDEYYLGGCYKPNTGHNGNLVLAPMAPDPIPGLFPMARIAY